MDAEEVRAVSLLVSSEARANINMSIDDVEFQQRTLLDMTSLLQLPVETGKIADLRILWAVGAKALATSCARRAVEKVYLQGIKIYALRHGAHSKSLHAV
jgi:hypothetical protein